MLVYKLKQHLKQQTGLTEMTHLKFSLTSQCHKTLRIVFKITDLVSSNNQSMQTHVN